MSIPFEKPAEGRSPVPQRSLPQAGESLQEHLQEPFWGRGLNWLLITTLVGLAAALEWWRYLIEAPPSPWFITTVFVVLLPLTIWRLRRMNAEADAIRLGIRGERIVGELLQELRERGYRVFHDLVGNGFNVDHILIGPGGVFAIETKTRTKPGRGSPTVVYDGERVLINGHEPDRDPLVQALAAARHVQQVLFEQTGQRVMVRPVVLYPGWYVECRTRGSRVYVANERYFLKSFDHEHRATVLKPDQIANLAAGWSGTCVAPDTARGYQGDPRRSPI